MWFSELKIVTPTRVIERGAIELKDGIINAIVEGDAPEESLATNGLTAIPGIIDLHGDMIERDIEPRPGAYFPFALAVYELDKRLVATGITTAYSAISFAWKKKELRQQENAIAIINQINAQRPELLSNMRVHARFEINNADTLPVLVDLLQQDKLHLVSLMDHTPGQGQFQNVERYLNFIKEWDNVQGELVAQDALERVKANIEETAATPRNWDVAREMTKLAAAKNIPVASHDDDTIEKVMQMAELGVSISEFPVTMAAAQKAQEIGMHVVMGAPNAYRDKSTSGNLRAIDGVKSGVVDSLATDYFPAAPLQAAFKIAYDGVLPLHEAINLVTRNPAHAASLTDTGRLEVGANADVVLVAEDFDHPRVHATFRDGEAVYWDVFMSKLSRGTFTRLMDKDKQLQ